MKKYLVLALAVALTSCDKEDSVGSSAKSIKADFSYSGTIQNFTPIQFTNTTVGAMRVKWQFSDGTSSTDENPVHIFRKAGKASAELEVFGPNLSNRKTKDFILSQADTASIIAYSLVGKYRMTKLVNTYFSTVNQPNTYNVKQCDLIFDIIKCNNNLCLVGWSNEFKLQSSDSQKDDKGLASYYKFSKYSGSSFPTWDLLYFKHDTDSIAFDQSSAGNGGTYHSIYYGKKMQN